jgi:antitoxin ChpS
MEGVAMTEVRLRKVGGSTMLAIPPALMEALEFGPNSPVQLSVSEGKLTVAPAKRRYTLDELLAQCEPGPISEEDREWLDMPSVGREL